MAAAVALLVALAAAAAGVAMDNGRFLTPGIAEALSEASAAFIADCTAVLPVPAEACCRSA